MRNPNKNTIKKIMRDANNNQKKGYYFAPWIQNEHTPTAYRAYLLFNAVGARLFFMSKGKICNRSLSGVRKYVNLK